MSCTYRADKVVCQRPFGEKNCPTETVIHITQSVWFGFNRRIATG